MIMTRRVYINNQLIGSVSDYSALPATLCPSCGSKLHRVYNTDTDWRYFCLQESVLVKPGVEHIPVKAELLLEK